MNKILSLILKKVGLVADGVLILSANTTSGWIAHQPKIPHNLDKFKKVK